jgi:hypothetical protein
MSWLVKNLIINSSNIRTECDMESDDYMSLLILEGKIKELREKGILNQDEIKLLVLVSNYKSFSQVSKEIGITRQVVSTKFNKITKKLAYYLGNYYTDLGYINYIARKYKFEEAQINKLMKFVLEN